MKTRPTTTKPAPPLARACTCLTLLAFFLFVWWRAPAPPPGASSFAAAGSVANPPPPHLDLPTSPPAGLAAERVATEPARSDDRDFVLGTLLPDLAEKNPEAAARVVADIEDEILRDLALDRLAGLWAARDLAAALAWADALPFADERETALIGVCQELAHASASEAAELLSARLPGDRPVSALEDLAHRWAETDLAGARTWALAQEVGPRREGLVARVALVESKRAPAEAMAWVLAELPPGEARDDAVVCVLHQWAKLDPEAADRRIASFAPGPLRNRAAHELRLRTSPHAISAQ